MPPPGAGFVTVIEGVPAVAISAAVIAAVTCPPLANVVTLGLPLKFTTEVETKFVPFTISVSLAVGSLPLTAISVSPVGVLGSFKLISSLPASALITKCVLLLNSYDS